MVTRFSSNTHCVTPGLVRECLSGADIQDWGKVQRTDSDAGDTMRAAAVGKLREDHRDASFVRVCILLLIQNVPLSHDLLV